jgi:alpha-methylacyl-CoA racemase
MFHALKAMGRWTDEAGTNLLDGGAHFYRTYKCGCGNYMSIGAIEPQFYAELRKLAGLADDAFDAQTDRAKWPELQKKLEAVFLTKTRDEWAKLLEGSDACAAAIVGLFEAPNHPHLTARKTFIEHEGRVQPAPAPRFSRTPSAIQHSSGVDALNVSDILAEWAENPPLRARA